jgi:hypothetical protein
MNLRSMGELDAALIAPADQSCFKVGRRSEGAGSLPPPGRRQRSAFHEEKDPLANSNVAVA